MKAKAKASKSPVSPSILTARKTLLEFTRKSTAKVFEAIQENPGQNQTQYGEVCDFTQSVMNATMKTLVSTGCVTVTWIGKSNIYTVNKERYIAFCAACDVLGIKTRVRRRVAANE